MLDIQMAKSIAQKALPNRRIALYISYKNLYVFQMFDDSDPIEGQFDPFFSVDKTSGQFAEFSVLTDGDTAEIMSLFQQASNGGN